MKWQNLFGNRNMSRLFSARSSRHNRSSVYLGRRQMQLEPLEERMLLTATLFVDFGDNFPGGTLTTTQGAFRDVADHANPGDKILGTEMLDGADGFNAATQLDIVAQVFSAADRDQMMDVVERAYRPLDVTVVELTAAAQTTPDGRSVAGATSMADVITTLRGGTATSKDAYVFVGTFNVDPGGANPLTYTGGGGLSPDSPTLGVASDLASASNTHDDVAVVYSSGGFSNNTLNNISHEAGHLFGLQHAITNASTSAAINLFHQAEIMSYRNTNATTSSIAFTRYPMIRGDGNSPDTPPNPVNYNDLAARNGQVTLFDQLAADADVLANPGFSFVSGTGAHDIITIARNGANADVTVQAFADAAYATPITVPSVGGTTYSFSFPLGNTILVYGGGSNDRIIVDGDLGVDVQIDGMLGDDTLIVDGKGAANATYMPNSTFPVGADLVGSLGGTVSIGGNSIIFENFETAGAVLIQNVGDVTYNTPAGGVDQLVVDRAASGNPQVTGIVNGGIDVIPLQLQAVNSLTVNTGNSSDRLIIDHSSGFIATAINYNGGENVGDNDTLRIIGTGATTGTYTPSATTNGDGVATVDSQTITFTGLEPVEISSMAAYTFTTPNGADDLNIINATASGLQSSLRVTGTSGGVGFEEPTFFDVNLLIVDAATNDAPADEIDTIDYDAPTAPQGISTVRIFTGDGEDVVNVDNTSPGIALQIDTGNENDLVRVRRTAAGSTTEITTGAGVGGLSDAVLIGVDAVVDFATDTGNTSNINGDVLVTDADFGQIYIDNSLTIVGQSIFVENIIPATGVFGVYGHQVRGIAPANILFDTTEDGGAGISDLLVASGSNNDTLTVNFDAAGAPGTFQSPLPVGIGPGFSGTFWDGGAEGGFTESFEDNRLVTQGGGIIQNITYAAGSLDSGSVWVQTPGITFPPVAILFQDVSRYHDDTTTINRTFNNGTPGSHKMVYGEALAVEGFLNSFSLDTTLSGFTADHDLIIEFQDLIDGETAGFPPWEFAANDDGTLVTINTSDDGDDDDKFELLQGNTAVVNANGFDGLDTFLVFDTDKLVNIDGGPPTTFPGDMLVLPDGAWPNAWPIGSFTLPDGITWLDAGGVIDYVNIEEVVAPDGLEQNESLIQAAALGSEVAIFERDLSISSPWDEDWFKVTAHQTGKFEITIHHVYGENRDLELAVIDGNGNVLYDVDTQTHNEELAIPVVGQENYYIRVRGSRTDGQTAANNFANYVLEIENFAAPVPHQPDLPAKDQNVILNDTGASQTDDITFRTDPQIIIQADLDEFFQEGIAILDAAQAEAMDTPGAAVEVFVNGNSVGFADPVPNTGNTKFLYDFTAGELPVELFPDASHGWLHNVKAAVTIIDAQQDVAAAPAPADGRTQLSVGLELVVDQVVPDPSTPNLLDSSDSGNLNDDNVTNVTQPAFDGIAEAGAIVRVFAAGAQVGSAVVGSDETDGVPNDQMGRWEVTVEPLIDGEYSITTEIEDRAGNLSGTMEDGLVIWIDTAAPNTAYLDLVGLEAIPNVKTGVAEDSDTGNHDSDNITFDDTPTVTITADDTINGNGNPEPNDLMYRLYDRPGNSGTNGEVLLVESSTGLGGLTTDGFFVHTLSQLLNDDYDGTIDGTPLAEGVHNFKLEVEDRAGNISHDYLLDVVIDVTLPPADIDLLDSSDTGISNTDNVTSMSQPAFDGRSEVNASVFVYAQQIVGGVPLGNQMLVGEGRVGSDMTDVMYGIMGATSDDRLGIWEVTVEPLADGVYDITSLTEDAAGNTSTSEPLRVWIDTVAPNTPYLDLVEASDSGRSDSDNVTFDNMPTVTVTADDTTDGNGNPFPNDLMYRIYDRPDMVGNNGEVLLVDSLVTEPGLSTDGFFTEVLSTLADGVTAYTLADGVHNLKLEVEDRAGNISHDFLLQVTIDTQAPPVTIIGIDPAATDTGIEGQPLTFDDRITSDTATGFVGTAEADAIVRLHVANDADDGSVALTVAVPLDGNKQFPDGQWNTSYVYDLNDPDLWTTMDGLRQVSVTAEDVAGNVSEPDELDIFIDTRGPQVNDVTITDDPDFDLFSPKSDPEFSQASPTPLVWSLDIDFIDQPERIGWSLGDDVVFVIDVSGSAGNPFIGTPVGDLNGDATPDTILDAEIAGFIALNQRMIDSGLGNTSNVSIVAFDSSGLPLDMDPVTAGVQLSTTPSADLDGNLIPDVEDALRALTTGLSSNYEDALQTTIQVINLVGTAPGNGNVIFLSDGNPTAGGTYNDEVATLQGMGHNLRAFGVGSGSSLPALQIIDPLAVQFSTMDELLDSFLGTGGSGFVYPAVNETLATMAGNIQLVGDANGIIPIESIEFIDNTVAGDIGQTIIRLNFFDALPDDRFTLTVSDRIKDAAGNSIDGETNTAEPQEDPLFPSGDGDPGEDFVARFTVDSRAEIGTWSAGSIYIDTNGNFTFDPQNADYTNRDLVYAFGYASDFVFAGNFAADAGDTADGFDKLASYGIDGGVARWLVDTDNNGVPDIYSADMPHIIGMPVAGNFDGSSVNGDEVGLFDGTSWFLDSDHDFMVNDEAAITIPGMTGGFPIVGDFDGDGNDDLATFQGSDASSSPTGVFTFALSDGVGGWLPVQTFTGIDPIGVRERPVAADMDGDGIDDIGLWVPDRSGMTPGEGGEWYFILSDDFSGEERVTGTVNTLDHYFSPYPLGDDIFAQFGDEFAAPVVGNFDPPVAGQLESGGPAIVNLLGTSGDDVLEFVAGSTPGQWTITLNSVVQGDVSGDAIALTFDGLGGNDQVTLVGSDGPDVAQMWPDRGTLVGTGYSVTVENVESIAIDTAGGDDVASFQDSPGDDTFKAGPGWATFAGPGFSHSVAGAEFIHAYARAGGADTAQLDDSPGNDKAKATSVYALLRGENFRNRAKFFETVTMTASGGNDLALMWDSPQDDIFVASAEASRFYSQNAPFDVTALAFDRVIAKTVNGGQDRAELHDSAGDDVFLGKSHKVQMFDRDTQGGVYDITARGFEDVTAIADQGGNDVAKLHDSAGDDLWEAGYLDGQTRSAMSSEARTLYEVLAFEQVKGYAYSGGQNSLRKNVPQGAVDFVIESGDWTELP